MMDCGFEKIDGRRYYQGWWMQWLQNGMVEGNVAHVADASAWTFLS